MKLAQASSVPKVAIGLAVALVAAVTLIGMSESAHRRSTVALDSMARESGTRENLARLLQDMLEVQTASRDFLLTGDVRHLGAYDTASARIGQDLELLRPGTGGPAEDEVAFEELSRRVQRDLADVGSLVRTRRHDKEQAPPPLLSGDVGIGRPDAVREQAALLLKSTATRSSRSQQQLRDTLMRARLGFAVATLVALLALWLSLRQSLALARAEAQAKGALEQERDRFDSQLHDRTASLAGLATHLQQEREAERGQLARELHDELGALLTAAKLDVARLKSRLDPQGAEVAQRLQHLTDSLNSGIALKRRIIEDLRPSSLSNLGLTASLEILAHEISDRTGVQVSTQLEPVALAESHQLTVYRLVQEALSNMAKYAHAGHVQVAVQAQGDRVEVAVQDDGKGFDVLGPSPTTHGLASMRHRVEAAGGQFTVESVPGQGTRVIAVLPALPSPA